MAAAFLEMVQSRGTIEPDEDVLEDAVAFAGVARYPARVKCALLGWMAWKDAVAQAGGTLTHPCSDSLEYADNTPKNPWSRP